MRSIPATLLIVVATTGLLCPQAEAATGIPVKAVSGSTITIVFGKNDGNVIVCGYYAADEKEHGFFGTLDGNCTTFDVGKSFTESWGINNEGFITREADSTSSDIIDEFERSPDESITLISKDGSPIACYVVQGIKSPGQSGFSAQPVG
jgi:hypothetical protein